MGAAHRRLPACSCRAGLLLHKLANWGRFMLRGRPSGRICSELPQVSQSVYTTLNGFTALERLAPARAAPDTR
jgi:hypothetical protein